MILDLNFTSASSEGTDEPVHLKSMTRAFAIHVHTVLPSVGVLGVFTSRNHARTSVNGSADVPDFLKFSRTPAGKTCDVQFFVNPPVIFPKLA